jgi:Domain of unknown function (DUF4123)
VIPETPPLRVLVDALWATPGEEVYAVLDAARHADIYPMVRGCGVRYACLYAGSIPRELAEVAPYLVRLWPDHPFTAKLLEAGWGQSWGVFVAARVDLEGVRAHLRRFLRVRREGDGRTLVFRYYDPRVLRTYLPTCTTTELSTFFGPLSRLVAEDETPSRAWIYANHGDAFTMRHLPLGRPAPSQS